MTMVYVSYIAPRRRFVAHRLGQIWACDLKELRARVTELFPDAEMRFVLSRGARAEVARRNGAPVDVGWT